MTTNHVTISSRSLTIVYEIEKTSPTTLLVLIISLSLPIREYIIPHSVYFSDLLPSDTEIHDYIENLFHFTD